MLPSPKINLVSRSTGIALATLTTLVMVTPGPSMAQGEPSSRPSGPSPVNLPGLENLDPNTPLDPNNPNNLRPLTQDSSLLSVKGGERLMTEASQAISSQNYAVAIQKLQDARQVFNQLSNFYQQLATSFSGIDNRLAETNRDKALSTAQLRDQATYQLALVHRSQNQPDLAVPLLVQIIRSQSPTREWGKKAYQQLLELGFVDTPYPAPKAEQPSSSTNK